MGRLQHRACFPSRGYAEHHIRSPASMPKCTLAHTYQVDALLTCPECGHEWQPRLTFDEGSHAPFRFPMPFLI
ncbi:hypothetical protein [Paracoccus luteus]|uniref:hypothetical protein n=1 Tax=Paracoccus luteus TaxID=2508543 RepID=UPI003CCC7C02